MPRAEHERKGMKQSSMALVTILATHRGGLISAHHDLEFALELLDLILCLDQIFAVQVAISSHCLIQVLLLLEPGLTLADLHRDQHSHSGGRTER